MWRYKLPASDPLHDALIVPQAPTYFHSELSLQPRMGDIQTRPFSKNYRSETFSPLFTLDAVDDMFLLYTVDL